MKVYILRHGQTDWNNRRLFQGQVDTELNEVGLSQARQCAERVQEAGWQFDKVYCSPLKRAMKTVMTVTGLPGEAITKDARLMEMNFGVLDSTSFDKDSPRVGNLFKKPSAYIPPEGAESFEEMEARIASFFEDLKKVKAESVLVGSHGCAIRGMLVHFGYLGLDDIWNQGIGNCAIVEVQLDEAGQYRVVKIHETQDIFATTAVPLTGQK